MTRSQLSREEVMAIIATQATRDARKAIANEVIVNESTLEALNQQVRKLHDFYLTMARQSPKAGVPV